MQPLSDKVICRITHRWYEGCSPVQGGLSELAYIEYDVTDRSISSWLFGGTSHITTSQDKNC